MENKITIKFVTNGDAQEVLTWPMKRALDVLREDLKLTGTKEGCGEGECGACSILIDGVLVNSCLVPVLQLQGKDITTIEGVSALKSGKIIQECFQESGGTQCGICTPGMVLASLCFVQSKQEPSRERIVEALAGNLCRCTGYTKIITAVETACKRVEQVETNNG